MGCTLTGTPLTGVERKIDIMDIWNTIQAILGAAALLVFIAVLWRNPEID